MTEKKWQIYILRSLAIANWHYTGQTGNLAQRFKTHMAGKVRSTKKYLPLEIAYTEDFESRYESQVRERELKKKRWELKKIYAKIDGNPPEPGS